MNLERGVYKYVIVEWPKYRVHITEVGSGRSHASLLEKGEMAAHAGYISSTGEEWIHGNCISDTLGIDGDPAHDIAHLTEHFGEPPLK